MLLLTGRLCKGSTHNNSLFWFTKARVLWLALIYTRKKYTLE